MPNGKNLHKMKSHKHDEGYALRILGAIDTQRLGYKQSGVQKQT